MSRLIYCYAECRYTESSLAECRGAPLITVASRGKENYDCEKISEQLFAS